MDFYEALKGVAELLKQVSSQTAEAYYWLITGDEPNSLCRLLGITEEEMNTVFVACRIFAPDTSKFSANYFQMLTSLAEVDSTVYKINKVSHRFILIGQGKDYVLPRDAYSTNGDLKVHPVQGKHTIPIRTKSETAILTTILSRQDLPSKDQSDDILVTPTPRKPKSIEVSSPKDVVFNFVESSTAMTTCSEESLSLNLGRRL